MKSTFAFLLTLSLSTAGQAALSLDDALSRAVQHNPQLLAQSAQERAATALIEQAGYRPNPTLDITLENFAGSGALRGIDALESTVGISQTLERGQKRLKRSQLATRARDATEQELALVRSELLAATAHAYLAVIAAENRLALAAEPLRLARETLAAADHRVSVGAGAASESARARVAVATAKTELSRRESDLTIARARLAALWGGTTRDIAPINRGITIPETLPLADNFLPRLADHPRLVWQHAKIETRRAALDLERAQAAQDISLSGGVRYLRDTSDAALVAGISVPLPVRNKNQAAIRAARETLAGAELEISASELALRTEFSAAWQELLSAHRSLVHLRNDALSASEEAHATVSDAYDAGQLPLIDVLDAQRELVALRREILELEIAYADALIRVEALANPSFSHTAALFSAR